MERNKLALLFILIFTVLSTIIGLFNITIQSSAGKSSTKLSHSRKILKEGDASALLLKIEGEIHSGKSTYSSTGADTVLARLREIEDRQDIKGILIEVNSPGGTVAASQEIYEELMLLRKTKKIVVSMKDLAASGGYYIAAAADYIFAESGTITGSIGVITMTPDISGLLEKYNVKMNVYKQGKYKDILSMYKAPSEEEEEIIQNMLRDTYNRFIGDVSRGRNIPKADVEKSAEGKIFSGEEALKNHLVDAIGGRREARAKLSELAGSDGLLHLIEDEDSPLDKFLEIFSTKMNAAFQPGHSAVWNELLRSPVLVLFPAGIRTFK